ncbi:MAG: FAA hydrolase family protein [Chloroflexi bacterium]|nr:MAG: FAA hydrolase family protein [Chloroflexota bacterium]
MKFVTFWSENELKFGVKTEAGILDVRATALAAGRDDLPTAPDAFFAEGLRYLPMLQAFVEGVETAVILNENTLTLAPTIPNPGKIICVGLNYRDHVSESEMELPDTPILFSKFNNALAAHNEPVPLPKNGTQFDYEGEMIAVIGKRAKNLTPDEALDVVLGYANGNDLSIRDWQFRSSQWLLGKTADKFIPVGPYLVTADEVGDPQNLDIKLWLNGELRQSSNTRYMIFSVAEIISYISQHMTLEPGDIISTGTPEGVILGMEQKVWLKPGDVLRVEVEKLGVLQNELVTDSR